MSSGSRVRILITNVQLNHRTGTEIVVRDLSAGLRRRGHDVAVYTRNPGVISDEMLADGTLVVTSLDEVPFKPDVIHCQHHTTTVDAVAAFPTTPALFVCHDRFQFEDIPPRFASITRFVAVDRNCYERLAYEAMIPTDRISMIHNAVDLKRFPLRSELTHDAGRSRRRAMWPRRPLPSPVRPRRAALFSNNTKGAVFTDVVTRACSLAELPLDIIGEGAGTAHPDPGQLLAGYDLVFSKARCALEALCSGCAVVLIDAPGMGPLVTRRNVDALREWNFGMRCLQGQPDVERLLEIMGRYDPADSRTTSTHIRHVANLEQALDQYEVLYQSLIQEGIPTVGGTPTARQGLTDVLSYAASLERLLRSGQPLLTMPPLPSAVAGHLTLESHVAPTTLTAGTTAHIQISLTNRSRETLSSGGATPVNLSYHWNVARSSSVPSSNDEHSEPRRTALSGTLRPEAILSQEVTVDVPHGCGHYFLDVTLVQENVMWFDQLEPPVLLRLPIEISKDEVHSITVAP